MKDSLIIYSGGLDSTTMLYEYRDQIALALSFNYGSKHNARELSFAQLHCRRLVIPHIVLTLDFFATHMHSSLLQGGADIPEASYSEDNMHSTVVPFRNGIMLSIAAGLAEDRGLQNVMIANHAGDHAVYPDCRPEFIASMGAALSAGTYNGVRLLAPYTLLSKSDIAHHGKTLGVNYAETWSCYKGGEHHCGQCATCRERRQALRQAGITDTTIYMD